MNITTSTGIRDLQLTKNLHAIAVYTHLDDKTFAFTISVFCLEEWSQNNPNSLLWKVNFTVYLK